MSTTFLVTEPGLSHFVLAQRVTAAQVAEAQSMSQTFSVQPYSQLLQRTLRAQVPAYHAKCQAHSRLGWPDYTS